MLAPATAKPVMFEPGMAIAKIKAMAETTIPMPLLFKLDPKNKKYNIIFKFDPKTDRWYIEFKSR